VVASQDIPACDAQLAIELRRPKKLLDRRGPCYPPAVGRAPRTAVGSEVEGTHDLHGPR